MLLFTVARIPCRRWLVLRVPSVCVVKKHPCSIIGLVSIRDETCKRLIAIILRSSKATCVESNPMHFLREHTNLSNELNPGKVRNQLNWLSSRRCIVLFGLHLKWDTTLRLKTKAEYFQPALYKKKRLWVYFPAEHKDGQSRWRMKGFQWKTKFILQLNLKNAIFRRKKSKWNDKLIVTAHIAFFLSNSIPVLLIRRDRCIFSRDSSSSTVQWTHRRF